MKEVFENKCTVTCTNNDKVAEAEIAEHESKTHVKRVRVRSHHGIDGEGRHPAL